MKILPSTGHGLGHVSHFEICTPFIFLERLKIKNFVVGALIEYNMF